MRHIILLALVGSTITFAQAPPVPSTYQDLYSSLSTQITSFQSTVTAGWNKSPYPVLHSAELEGATSDNFTSLLAPGYYDGTVIPELDEIEALGAKAVTFHTNFPVLYRPFYASNPALYQQFVTFYQQLASDVRARGMKVIIEDDTSTNEPGTQAASFYPYYKSLSWSAYMAGRAQNAVNVAQLIQPDYMTVITEPDSEAQYTSQTNAGTASGSAQLLQTILTAISAAGVNQNVVQIGAGAGTWLPSFTQFIQAYAATNVQYIDMHVYPINRSFFTNVLTAADIAHAAGKQVGMTEAWLYKVRDSELGITPSNTLYARDPFSFWEPLDMAFHQALIDAAQYKQFTFTTPAWPRYFFSYLDYNVYGGDSSDQLLIESFTIAAAANRVGTFSTLALPWQNAILPAPDRTAPITPAAPTYASLFGNSVQILWTPTTDNIGVAGYNVYRNGQIFYTSSYLFTCWDQTLLSGNTYTYYVTAFDAAGNESAPSAPLVIQTLDNVAPSVPTGLTVTAPAWNSVNLSWNASTDNVGVTGYRIMKGTSATSLSPFGTSTTLNFTDSLIRASTTYYYAVKAYDARGNTSAQGPTVTVTTPAMH